MCFTELRSANCGGHLSTVKKKTVQDDLNFVAWHIILLGAAI